MTEEDIARRVRSYWLARGYEVDARVRDFTLKTGWGAVHYSVARSNLIGGLPPGYQDLTANQIAARAG